METENSDQELVDKIEAILFIKGVEVGVKELTALVGESEEVVTGALTALADRLNTQGGLALVRTATAAMLTTQPRLSQTVETVVRHDLQKDLGRAGRETLAIILYHHPIAKREIDHIRGVNSATILRNLTIRGLVKKELSTNGLSTLYSPGLDLLAHLGVQSVEQLPDKRSLQEGIRNLLTGEDQ